METPCSRLAPAITRFGRSRENLAPQAFSSHPVTDKRIRWLEAKWEKLKDKSGFIEYEGVKPESNQ